MSIVYSEQAQIHSWFSQAEMYTCTQKIIPKEIDCDRNKNVITKNGDQKPKANDLR